MPYIIYQFGTIEISNIMIKIIGICFGKVYSRIISKRSSYHTSAPWTTSEGPTKAKPAFSYNGIIFFLLINAIEWISGLLVLMYWIYCFIICVASPLRRSSGFITTFICTLSDKRDCITRCYFKYEYFFTWVNAQIT